MQKKLNQALGKLLKLVKEEMLESIEVPVKFAQALLRNFNQNSSENILWEAPQKSQQVWFIKLMGANVNLGNIAPHEVIPLSV